MFKRTTAINKIITLKKFTRGVQGGTSAGKTYGIIPILIDKAIKTPNLEISIVSESMPHLRRGCRKDFKKIMIESGRWNDASWHDTESRYTFSNNSFIEFFSADMDSKLRGARRDWLYMNECNNLNFHTYTELASRTKIGVYLDWNPTQPFWFHEELLGDEDVDYLTVTYLDNEACPESALRFILKAKEKAAQSEYWDNWYKVYGLGQLGALQGTIFTDWVQCRQVPENAAFVGYGMDFGFSNDPTAVVEVYKQNGELWINELVYQTGLTNPEICNIMRPIMKKERELIADSAEPKSIKEIQNQGWNIHPAHKGADSIRSSIDVLQRFKMNITSNSLNLIKELRGYKWATNKEGKETKAPTDFNNHLLDALRYVALNKLALNNSGRYFITSV